MTERAPESRLLTTAEVAERLRRSQRFVVDELRRKNLRGAKYGGGWGIREDDLDTYIEAHMNVTPVRKRTRPPRRRVRG